MALGDEQGREARHRRGGLGGAGGELQLKLALMLQARGLAEHGVGQAVLVVVLQAAAGGQHVHGGAVVGVLGAIVEALALGVVSADGDHEGGGGRVTHELLAGVAGGAHHDHALGGGGEQRLLEHRAREVALAEGEAHVDHVGAVVHGVHDGLSEGQLGAGEVLVEHPEGHEPDLGGVALERRAALWVGGDHRGDVGAVAVGVLGHRVALYEVVGGHPLRAGDGGGVADAAVQQGHDDVVALAPVEAGVPAAGLVGGVVELPLEEVQGGVIDGAVGLVAQVGLSVGLQGAGAEAGAPHDGVGPGGDALHHLDGAHGVSELHTFGQLDEAYAGEAGGPDVGAELLGDGVHDDAAIRAFFKKDLDLPQVDFAGCRNPELARSDSVFRARRIKNVGGGRPRVVALAGLNLSGRSDGGVGALIHTHRGAEAIPLSVGGGGHTLDIARQINSASGGGRHERSHGVLTQRTLGVLTHLTDLPRPLNRGVIYASAAC